MRYLNILLFLLLATLACAQRSLSVVWKTSSGIVDSGELKRFQSNLTNEEELVFFKSGPDTTLVSAKEIDWVTHAGDTILLRRMHRRRSELMLLLQQGEVRLYRLISTMYSPQYYLVKGDQWENFSLRNARTATYNILRQNCQQIAIPQKIRTDYQAINLARQVNECLNASSENPAYLWKHYRQSIGIVTHLPWTRFSSIDDRNKRHFRNPDSEQPNSYPLRVPLVSALYDRQLFRNQPLLVGQLQLAFSYQNRSSASQLAFTPIPVSEQITFAGLYLYPGLQIYTGIRRKLQLSLGAGGAFVVPLYSKRELRFTDPNHTLAGEPITQALRRIVDGESGFYLQAGVHWRMRKRFSMGLSIRADYLVQRWRYYEEEGIFYSNAFRNTTILAYDYNLRMRLATRYHW